MISWKTRSTRRKIFISSKRDNFCRSIRQLLCRENENASIHGGKTVNRLVEWHVYLDKIASNMLIPDFIRLLAAYVNTLCPQTPDSSDSPLDVTCLPFDNFFTFHRVSKRIVLFISPVAEILLCVKLSTFVDRLSKFLVSVIICLFDVLYFAFISISYIKL